MKETFGELKAKFDGSCKKENFDEKIYPKRCSGEAPSTGIPVKGCQGELPMGNCLDLAYRQPDVYTTSPLQNDKLLIGSSNWQPLGEGNRGLERGENISSRQQNRRLNCAIKALKGKSLMMRRNSTDGVVPLAPGGDNKGSRRQRPRDNPLDAIIMGPV